MSVFIPSSEHVQKKWDRARSFNPKYFDKLMALADTSGGPDACWNTIASKTRDGYGQIRVNGPKQRTHRLMFQWFYPDAEFIVVRHVCNNPACCNPAHLRGGTQKDNAADRKIAGREGNHKGTRNGRAKINEEQALFIRYSELPVKELSAMFGLTTTVIHNIKSRKLWKHI